MTDAQIIAKGNEMLAQAGLPPLTPDQAAKFLSNREARAKDRREGWLLLGGTFATGFLFAKMFPKLL